MQKLFIVAVLLSLTTTEIAAQHYRRDTLHGMPASKFWGNSTYFSAGISFARNHEYEFNIGRTFARAYQYPRGLGQAFYSSWGIGYGYSPVLNGTHTIKAFYEKSYCAVIPTRNHFLRAEYIYNASDQQHYLRPAAGFDFFFGVIGYHYSFLLNKNDGPNIYRHGFTLRAKTYTNRKRWFREKTIVL